jgi:hypothetical protein
MGLKVGDKVKVIKQAKDGWNNFAIGVKGVIEHIDGNRGADVFLHSECRGHFPSDCLEKVDKYEITGSTTVDEIREILGDCD